MLPINKAMVKPLLSDNNIESELSYAYLHAVAAKAALGCEIRSRHHDNNGVDATLSYRGETESDYLRESSINVQLKATTADPRKIDGFISYDFKEINQYNRLTENSSDTLLILVVLFLPKEKSSWLSITIEELIIRNSAYWVCLYKAEKSNNQSSQVVYFPEKNLVTPSALEALAKTIAVTKKWPEYLKPSK